MKIYKKAILPLDFRASGLACGIKRSGKPDLALFYSNLDAKASCMFTSNTMQAAPIKVCKENLRRSKKFRAIIVNSGNANCFTGRAGLNDACRTAKLIAENLGINKNSVLVASTGIIGRRIPLHKIKKAIPALAKGLSKKGIDKAKLAILTTDSVPKEVSVKFMLGKQQVRICGVAKGAGMISPNMATMLAFVLTDANISQKALGKSLEAAVDNSFNCITVDGCMSTNDAVIVLANGAAANPVIDKPEDLLTFTKAISVVCLELAKMIIRDAEGATKFIRIKISSAKNAAEARRIALAIANSNLFKTAFYGENPNFGRIVAAIGASGVEIKEKDLRIKVSSLKKKDVNVHVFVKRGKSEAVIYTSDLSPEYVKINAEYN